MDVLRTIEELNMVQLLEPRFYSNFSAGPRVNFKFPPHRRNNSDCIGWPISRYLRA